VVQPEDNEEDLVKVSFRLPRSLGVHRRRCSRARATVHWWNSKPKIMRVAKGW